MQTTSSVEVKKSQNTNWKEKAEGKSVILFDGVCNLCNGAINFVIDRDEKGYFHFASLQSDFGQALLIHLGKNTQDFDSMIVYENGNVKTKSSAAVHIAKHLSGAWKALGAFWIVPKFLRDGVYNLVAKNRYNWFGKKNECRIPTPDLKARFLD